MTPPLKSLKRYRELAGRKGRTAAGAFLVEGERAILQVATAAPGAIMEILTTGECPPELRRYPARSLTGSQFRYISTGQNPAGIAAVVALPPDVYSDTLSTSPGNRLLLLEDVQDPGNAGTLIRTAAAFGFAGVVTTENGADPFAPKVVQATAGSILSVWLRRPDNYRKMLRELHDQGYTVAAADLQGKERPEVLRGKDKIVLALGNEAAGLSAGLLEMADYRISIPVAVEKAESLNAAACGAILMYLNTVDYN